MKKITTLLLFFTLLNLFSQDKTGDREATIFYPTIDRFETAYKINIDLYELGNVNYIEAELFNDSDIKLISKLLKLTYKDKKYYISHNDGPEKEVTIYNINLELENPDNNINYPQIKIKLLDSNYNVIDFSRKIFY